MSFKSIDMGGEDLDDAQGLLKKASAEIRYGTGNVERIKEQLIHAQEKLNKDSGKTSQDLSKNVNDTINDLTAILSSGGNLRQKLNDIAADVDKVSKKIETEKNTRADLDRNNTKILNSLTGRMSAINGGLNTIGRTKTNLAGIKSRRFYCI